MSDFIQIAFLVLVIAAAITIKYLIRKGKLKRVNTYSYKTVIGESIRHVCISFIICFLAYLYSKSLEGSLTLFIVSLFFILAGFLRTLYMEHRIKQNGGREEGEQ